MINKLKWELVLFLVLAVLSGASVFFWLKNIESRYQLVSAPRARVALSAPVVIKADDIEMIKVPAAALPENAILKQADLVGAVLTRPLTKGAWFTKLDLVYERDPESDATLAPAGLVAVVLPGTWFLNPLPKIKPHDYLQIFLSAGTLKSGETKTVIFKTLLVLRSVAGKDNAPSSVLVAATPDDAKDLAKARANQMVFLAAAMSAGVSWLPNTTSTP